MTPVSIICPVHNADAWLEEALHSAASQDLSGLEIICIDDGSADGSRAILDRFARNCSRAKVFGQDNAGVASARNRGIDEAQGDYVAFLDPDDKLPSSDVLRQLYRSATSQEADLCGGSLVVSTFGSERSRFAGVTAKQTFQLEGWMDYREYQFDFGFQRFIYRREFLQTNNIRFPAYSRYQDVPFFVDAMACAGRFYALPMPTYWYRTNEHAPVNWVPTRVRDMLLAVGDVLETAQRRDFPQLARLTMVRLLGSHAAALEAGILADRALIASALDRVYSLAPRSARSPLASLMSGCSPKDLVLPWTPDTETEWVENGGDGRVREHVATPGFVRQPLARVRGRFSSEPPLVSVVMPSFNVGQYIDEALQSVLDQTLMNIEVICVDAGSTDGTLSALERVADVDGRVHVVRSDYKSYGYQMNLGLAAARGAYLGIVETDDYIEPDMYSTLVDVAESTHADIVKGGFTRFTGDGDSRQLAAGEIAAAGYYDRVLEPQRDPLTIALRGELANCCGIYRREFLNEHRVAHNESPGASFQDTGFFVLANTHANRLVYLRDCLYNVRRDNPASSTFSKTKMFAIAREYEYLEANLSADQPRLARFRPAITRRKWWSYEFNALRLAGPDRALWESYWRTDIREAMRAGTFDTAYFDDSQMAKVDALLAAEAESYGFLTRCRTCRTAEPSDAGRPSVSVIIPVFNSEEHVEGCLDSACSQTREDIEILCVDDGSTDGTRSLIRERMARDDRVRLVEQCHSGQGPARNLGVDSARGDYLVFLDSDDALHHQALEYLVREASRDHLDVLYFDAEACYDTDELRLAFPYYRHGYSRSDTYRGVYSGPELFARLHEQGEYVVSPCLQMIRAEYLAESGVRFPDPHHAYEDNLFTAATMLSAERVSHRAVDLYRRRVRAGSVMTATGTEESAVGYLRVFLGLAALGDALRLPSYVKHWVAHEMRAFRDSYSSAFRRLGGVDHCVQCSLPPVDETMFRAVIAPSLRV